MFCDNKDKNDAGFRMSVESYGRKSTYESAYSDERIEDILDGFLGMMTAISWSPNTVIAAMDEYVRTHRSMLAYLTDDEDKETE